MCSDKKRIVSEWSDCTIQIYSTQRIIFPSADIISPPSSSWREGRGRYCYYRLIVWMFALFLSNYSVSSRRFVASISPFLKLAAKNWQSVAHWTSCRLLRCTSASPLTSSAAALKWSQSLRCAAEAPHMLLSHQRSLYDVTVHLASCLARTSGRLWAHARMVRVSNL